ncbi:TRAP transporter small permease subunit [Zobellella iuensis]|uniref:TRAP transporter small permease protein n=1 Tax=Zobellella iuensis TaxID=2803811 RepID=A0ABS1QP44_9GAMM|nr:TRAP transporter small permease subunit [Zobellella iuensis]MBL1376064.1 TRAP transporter small permease subunit [Zobellella iuensis]
MKLITGIERITRLAGALGALLILPLTCALVFEVFSRYVLNAPTLWAFEVSYMIMGAIFMLGMANALRLGQHVSVDVVSMKLGPRANAAIHCLCYALFLPIIGWLTWELAHYLHEAYVKNERSGRSAWNPIMWPVYATWFVGFLLLGLQLLAEMLKSAAVLVTNEEVATA